MRETETALISRIKEEVKWKEWEEQIRECRNSGLTVAEWCRQNDVKVKNYYYHLRRVRERICESQDREIVPVSISSEISCSEIQIEKNGMKITLPSDISAEILKVLVRELC